MDKLKVILDTDMENEIDDQFALTYLLKSLDRFDLKAITMAPFSGSKYAPEMSIKDGIDHSYDTTIKILEMLKLNLNNIVYKGSVDYMINGYEKRNEAVNKIIELAKENDKIYIMAIGAITNVALAIKNDPSIIDKINIVWLGGNSFLYNQNDEFNFKQDLLAVKTVLESKANLTIIPCINVASHLTTTIYELEHFLKGSVIGDFLCEQFDECKERTPGNSKTLWDLSAVAYLINKDWFNEDTINCPGIDNEGNYIINYYDHQIRMVKYLKRNHIYEDFFTKMEAK